MERALGPDHPNVAHSLNSLALALADLGRTAEAERLHRRALAVSERALGPDHPLTRRARQNLARLSIRSNPASTSGADGSATTPRMRGERIPATSP